METINHECYVSLEVAKLLKEASFDWKLNSRWQDWGRKNSHEFILKTDLLYADGPAEYDGFHALPAPTLDVAQRWLREVKGIDIEISAHVGMLHKKVYMPYISFYKPYVITENDKHFGITQEEAKEWVIQNKFPLVYKDEIYPELPAHQWFDTYEEAQEAGIKKALELILEKGE